MAWLFFMDESGHDHKNCPMEARGGIAIQEKELFRFSEDMGKLEERVFGAPIAALGKSDFEIKGSKLLDKKTFEQAQHQYDFSDEERKAAVKEFLNAGQQGKKPTKRGFCAWGQSKLLLADMVFDLLKKYRTPIFVSMIPRGANPPPDFRRKDDLRKDQVFLFERYFNFLEIQDDYGLIIMDETEKENDRKFVRQMARYFTKTERGRSRARRIVPTPFFVASDMMAAVQAADLCIYAANWGFRLPSWEGEQRKDIAKRYGGLLSRLQFSSEVFNEDTRKTHESYGIVYVPDPYTAR